MWESTVPSSCFALAAARKARICPSLSLSNPWALQLRGGGGVGEQAGQHPLCVRSSPLQQPYCGGWAQDGAWVVEALTGHFWASHL